MEVVNLLLSSEKEKEGSVGGGGGGGHLAVCLSVQYSTTALTLKHSYRHTTTSLWDPASGPSIQKLSKH